ncbi:MAG: bifunctional phosphoribosylaminoimidazolecarboxamide formyltransferase/IMP cyclohydrolase [Bdellovibrionales bacterium]|nr:bifunctional phosphoribosylaminoimidazolecarboxamide formyltransferase/IMP cyclohydrolase [Bdellovibrionales bacterium]
MDQLRKVKRALISVSDKTGLDDLVRYLSESNVEILASGGTYQHLKSIGVNPIDVSSYTQSPELFDGRVKTLHPKIHGGILAVRDNDTHVQQMQEHGILEIDLVVVSLYPFEEALQKPGISEEELIEKIDIGGPSLIRSAAKNYRYVSVLVQPEQYKTFINELKENSFQTSLSFRRQLAKEAFSRTAAFDATISTYFRKNESIIPPSFTMSLRKMISLRYGENPHQQSGYYMETHKQHTCLENILQGKQISYNNIQDIHAGVSLCMDMNAPFCTVIIKHGNPCGVGISSSSLEESYKRALECDPVSAFGGIVVFSAPVNGTLAQITTKLFTEIVVSPQFSPEARTVYSKKTNLRLVEIEYDTLKNSLTRYDIRRALDGYLVQDVDRSTENLAEAKIVTTRSPSSEEFEALSLAWKTSKHVKSNAIIVSNSFQTLGIGAGQMNRLASVKLATQALPQGQSVLALASDAFFPFRDGVDEAAKYGVTCIVQPGGSVKDNEVIDAANAHQIAMIFTGVRHFNH